MATNSDILSERRVLDALAILSRACASGAVPEAAAPDAPAGTDEAAQEALGEAALAVAFGAFLARGGEAGPMQTLIASIGLLETLAGEEPDPPAEILGIAAEDDRVGVDGARTEQIDCFDEVYSPMGEISHVALLQKNRPKRTFLYTL